MQNTKKRLKEFVPADWQLQAELERVKQQRDELLAALKLCPSLGFKDTILNDWWNNTAKPAIANTEKEAK